MAIPLEVPTTSVSKLINELVRAIRTGGKASVSCTEVALLRTMLPTAAGASLAQASEQLVPTVSIRIQVPPVGSARTGVSKDFQDAIKAFGELLTDGLEKFVQRPDVMPVLGERNIGKVIVAFQQYMPHGRESVERKELVIGQDNVLSVEQKAPTKRTRKQAVA